MTYDNSRISCQRIGNDAIYACLPASFDAVLERHDVPFEFYAGARQAYELDAPLALSETCAELGRKVLEVEVDEFPFRPGAIRPLPGNPFESDPLPGIAGFKPRHEFLKDKIAEGLPGERALVYITLDNAFSEGCLVLAHINEDHIAGIKQVSHDQYLVVTAPTVGFTGQAGPFGLEEITGVDGSQPRYIEDIDGFLPLPSTEPGQSDTVSLIIFPPEPT